MSDPLPWTVLIDGAQARLTDPAGTLRAVVTDDEPGVNPMLAFPGGRLAEGRPCSLVLPDGRRFPFSNGDRGGLKRERRTARVQIDGVEWVYRHTSDRRAVISRDGALVAKLHHKWKWGFARSVPGVPVEPRCTFSKHAALQPFDELMVTVFGVALGPPGREGAFGQVGHGIASIGSIFS